jgi:hypothetical protein
MADRRNRSDLVEREPHRPDADALAGADRGDFRQAVPVESPDADDQLADGPFDITAGN